MYHVTGLLEVPTAPSIKKKLVELKLAVPQRTLIIYSHQSPVPSIGVSHSEVPPVPIELEAN